MRVPTCSGGGKSTVASMLMGLYEPGQGEILVDGVPLSQLDMQVGRVGAVSCGWIPRRWEGGAFFTLVKPPSASLQAPHFIPSCWSLSLPRCRSGGAGSWAW